MLSQNTCVCKKLEDLKAQLDISCISGGMYLSIPAVNTCSPPPGLSSREFFEGVKTSPFSKRAAKPCPCAKNSCAITLQNPTPRGGAFTRLKKLIKDTCLKAHKCIENGNWCKRKQSTKPKIYF